MRRRRVRIGAVLGLSASFLLSASLAAAQSSGPYAAYVFPAGGQRGSTFTIVVAGQNLNGPLGAELSGGGARVEVLSYTGKGGPLTKVQEEELRQRLQELAGKPREASAGRAAAPVALPDLSALRNLESKSKAQLRLVVDEFLNRDKRPKPPMDELVSLEITLAPDAAEGERTLRLLARGGLSNPLVFEVGDRPEAREPSRFAEPPSEPPLLAVPSVTNGQIFPGEVDRFRLRLDAGETVALAVEARSLIPYLADAVPGWFQAVLAVSGPDGREAAYCDDDGLDPDPRLVFRAPAAGVYGVAVRDAIYRGREDFVYRLRVEGSARASGSVGTAPPDRSTPAAPPDRSTPAAPLTPPAAAVPFPSTQRGVLAAPGEVHVYEFTGRAGETIVAEVRARRDGSPLDSFLRLHDPAGTLVAANDDTEDKRCGLLTAQTDSYLRVALPADGAYRLELLDATGKGGEAWTYVLDLRRPEPDFAVLTTVSALNLAPTGSAAFTAVAVRRDGFQGDITVRLRRPDRGLALTGGLIPAGRERMPMTVTASRRDARKPATLELEAVARIAGVEVVHPVTPADQRLQAFGNTHLVAAEALWVVGRGNAAPAFALTPSPPLTLGVGGSVHFTIRHPELPVRDLRVQLVSPPTGIVIGEQSATADGITLSLAAEAGANPGAENLLLLLRGVAADPQARGREVELGFIPAVVLSVIAVPAQAP